MHSVSTQISFSQNQVDEFGRLTGDDGPVHSADGVVQGGLIISSLPKCFRKLMIENKLLEGYTHNVGVILEAKFRKKLYIDTAVTVEFTYNTLDTNNLHLEWQVFDSQTRYCNGMWIVHKSKS
jgi:hypothetical protein